MNQYSTVVTDGMKRVCADFSPQAMSLGFHKTKARLWARANQWSADSIYFFRSGSTYGAPRTASIDIRVELAVRVLNHPSPGGSIGINSHHVRRPNGYSYHHRFNAETWSTYDRCLDELGLFVAEFAEPWFKELKDPDKLLSHPELSSSARTSLEQALSAHPNAENVASSLKGLGLKAQAHSHLAAIMR